MQLRCSRGAAEVQPRCGRGAAEVQPRSRCNEGAAEVRPKPKAGRGAAEVFGSLVEQKSEEVLAEQRVGRDLSLSSFFVIIVRHHSLLVSTPAGAGWLRPGVGVGPCLLAAIPSEGREVTQRRLWFGLRALYVVRDGVRQSRAALRLCGVERALRVFKSAADLLQLVDGREVEEKLRRQRRGQARASRGEEGLRPTHPRGSEQVPRRASVRLVAEV